MANLPGQAAPWPRYDDDNGGVRVASTSVPPHCYCRAGEYPNVQPLRHTTSARFGRNNPKSEFEWIEYRAKQIPVCAPLLLFVGHGAGSPFPPVACVYATGTC